MIAAGAGGEDKATMADSPRDVETEMIDLSGLTPSDLDRFAPSTLSNALVRILAYDEDSSNVDPLFGGETPRI
jgi:hypothetical protein